jgi:hypothetical protein
MDLLKATFGRMTGNLLVFLGEPWIAVAGEP